MVFWRGGGSPSRRYLNLRPGDHPVRVPPIGENGMVMKTNVSIYMEYQANHATHDRIEHR